jgi:hypothetical protein
MLGSGEAMELTGDEARGLIRWLGANSASAAEEERGSGGAYV